MMNLFIAQYTRLKLLNITRLSFPSSFLTEKKLNVMSITMNTLKYL